MLRPEQAITTQFQQGVALFRAGRVQEAERAFRTVLAVQPKHADSLHRLGIIALETDRPDQAARLFTQALKQAPGLADLHWNHGAALRALGRTDEALAAFRRALRLKPNAPDLHRKLGTWLRDLGRLEESVGRYQKALQLQPADAEAHHGLALAHKMLGRRDAALAAFHESLRLAPENAETHYNLALTLLQGGEMEEGWREYEWRWQMPFFEGGQRLSPFKRHECPQPAWDGTALQGRTLLVHAEQGLGDALQFCRFVPPLARENDVILFASQRLTRLFSTLKDVKRLVTPEAELPPFDVYCSLMSLPGLMGVTLANLPAETPYLAADPAATAQWDRRLTGFPGLRVGLVWAGNPTFAADVRRSIAPAQLSALAGLPGVTFVSLQKNVEQIEAESSPPPIPGMIDWTGELDDFADTAALVDALDIIVSVDTAVAHLAGALGKPVWLLNRFDPCWRWLTGRDDSPWYPTLRQFTQARPGDWGDVLRRVRTALGQMAEASPRAAVSPQ